MSSKKVNNALSQLIEEIKNKEKENNNNNRNHKSSKTQGADIARSLLKNNCGIKNNKFFFLKDEREINSRGDINQVKCKREDFNKQTEDREDKKLSYKQNGIDCNKEQEEEMYEDDEYNDSLSESEKQVLRFYDPTIDDYDEEYVTRKYRFMDTNCDSSLCCCGCFTPVCYKSKRHPIYINSFQSLYAVSVAIEKEKTLSSKEIKLKRVTKGKDDTSEEDVSSLEESEREQNEESEREQNEESESEQNEKSESEQNEESEREQNEESEREQNEESEREQNKESKSERNEQNEGNKKSNKTQEAVNIIQTKNKKQKKNEKMKNFTYYPVFCVNCNNHLAYYEIETKLFHFFDVLPD